MTYTLSKYVIIWNNLGGFEIENRDGTPITSSDITSVEYRALFVSAEEMMVAEEERAYHSPVHVQTEPDWSRFKQFCEWRRIIEPLYDAREAVNLLPLLPVPPQRSGISLFKADLSFADLPIIDYDDGSMFITSGIEDVSDLTLQLMGTYKISGCWSYAQWILDGATEAEIVRMAFPACDLAEIGSVLSNLSYKRTE